MANYLINIKPFSANNIEDAASFVNVITQDVCTVGKNINLNAIKFKRQTNFAKEDLEEIRRLICVERNQQNHYEFQFWTPDFDRMMLDDWLVTRFLLRGFKMANKKFYREQVDKQRSLVYQETMNLIKLCAAFRLEYNINGLTEASEFPNEWLKTNGLFNHLQDHVGNPVVYLRIKLHKPKLIGTQELRHQFKRLLLFTLEECDRNLTNKTGKGICCVFDMSDATFSNVDLELLTWMIKSAKNFGPKLISYMIVYNLPWIFTATFKLISNTILSNSNKQSLRFVYGLEILNFISRNNLPSYIRDGLN